MTEIILFGDGILDQIINGKQEIVNADNSRGTSTHIGRSLNSLDNARKNSVLGNKDNYSMVLTTNSMEFTPVWTRTISSNKKALE